MTATDDVAGSLAAALAAFERGQNELAEARDELEAARDALPPDDPDDDEQSPAAQVADVIDDLSEAQDGLEELHGAITRATAALDEEGEDDEPA